MIKRKDYNGNEYYNATDAAKFLGMAGSTFLYFYDPRNQLQERFKPKYHIFRGKRIWWISELNEWKKFFETTLPADRDEWLNKIDRKK